MKKIMALFLVLATVLSLMTVGAYAAADNALSVSCKLYDGYTVVTVQKSGTVYYTTDGSKPTSKSKKLNSTRIKVSATSAARSASLSGRARAICARSCASTRSRMSAA